MTLARLALATATVVVIGYVDLVAPRSSRPTLDELTGSFLARIFGGG